MWSCKVYKLSFIERPRKKKSSEKAFLITLALIREITYTGESSEYITQKPKEMGTSYGIKVSSYMG